MLLESPGCEHSPCAPCLNATVNHLQWCGCTFVCCFEGVGAPSGAQVPKEQCWAPLAPVVRGKAVPASSSARLLQAGPHASISEAEEPWGTGAVIQLFAAGDCPRWSCSLCGVSA